MNAKYVDLNITDWTVFNGFHNLNYINIVPKSIPFLIDKHKQNHMEFAIKYRNQNWNQVIFSDETIIQMFRNSQKAFYKVGTQSSQKAMVKHLYKIHVWDAFSVKGEIGVLLFTEIIDGAFYYKILTENLFDNANLIMGKRWIFQQDNNPKYTAKETKKLLSEWCLTLLDWPSNSPDLNPIENLPGLSCPQILSFSTAFCIQLNARLWLIVVLIPFL